MHSQPIPSPTCRANERVSDRRCPPTHHCDISPRTPTSTLFATQCQPPVWAFPSPPADKPSPAALQGLALRGPTHARTPAPRAAAPRRAQRTTAAVRTPRPLQVRCALCCARDAGLRVPRHVIWGADPRCFDDGLADLPQTVPGGRAAAASYAELEGPSRGALSATCAPCCPPAGPRAARRPPVAPAPPAAALASERASRPSARRRAPRGRQGCGERASEPVLALRCDARRAHMRLVAGARQRGSRSRNDGLEHTAVPSITHPRPGET
ncbi:hypothetical protein PsYK624_033620 [Phanerochaete sordida]|uniref:Uncharacterized protein n=1 Tax=Phanerochaete sordida TaxID=48140 RepID=A0A9P3LA83_9APHY|nr:hypothetical protein PsYK624_033620 [Phanerochaete sordida]